MLLRSFFNEFAFFNEFFIFFNEFANIKGKELLNDDQILFLFFELYYKKEELASNFTLL